MDVGLDGALDGIGTAHHIHAKFGIPVLLLTANPENPRITEAIGTAVSQLVNKPFLDETLMDVIEKVLGRRDPGSTAAGMGQG